MKRTAKVQTILADLHVHTCLSPCAGLDMTPRKIVAEALRRGLSMIAVTDHNSAQNVPAVMICALQTKLCVIPGMEITTAEEAHVVALFPTVEAAGAMQELVFEKLQPGENDEELFGMQVIANEFDEVEGFNTRLLIGNTELSVDEVVEQIHGLGGLAIAAHIDRPSYSILSQLGFIPDYLELDALEFSRNLTAAAARERFSEYGRLPFVASSDSHSLADLGTCSTRLRLARVCFAELRMALRSERGRGIVY